MPTTSGVNLSSWGVALQIKMVAPVTATSSLTATVSSTRRAMRFGNCPPWQIVRLMQPGQKRAGGLRLSSILASIFPFRPSSLPFFLSSSALFSLVSHLPPQSSSAWSDAVFLTFSWRLPLGRWHCPPSPFAIFALPTLPFSPSRGHKKWRKKRT